jgi:mercuric ion transport protein
VAVGTLAYKARQRRGYAPFALGIAGAITIVVGKFYLDNDFLNKDFIGYAGIFLLIAASVWNVWPRKGATGVKLHLKPCDENKHT